MNLLELLKSKKPQQAIENPMFQLGVNILGNNTGHYGELGPALSGGLQDYQRQRSLQAQQNRANQQAEYQKELAVRQQAQHEQMMKQYKQKNTQYEQSIATQKLARERANNVRNQFPNNAYAQLDPKAFLASQAQLNAQKSKTDSANQFKIGLEQYKSGLGNENKRIEQERGYNLEQYGNPYGPQGQPSHQVPQGQANNAGSKRNPKMSFKQQQQVAFEQAKQESKTKAEDAQLLETMEASMPSLIEMTNELKELAKSATFTYAGQMYDEGLKQGFGKTTEGGLSRKKFEATVNNSVLPLLRQTFGAAFTAVEGESLRKTLGDINASPEEKVGVINAFIENKVREIQTKQRKVKGYKAIPSSKEGLVTGQIYTTPKGPLKWNGTSFEDL